jgi:hypothetical protein
VNEDVDISQQLVDNGRIAQVAVHDVFAGVQRFEWRSAARRAQIDAALLQFNAQNASHIAAGAGERNLGHRSHPL